MVPTEYKKRVFRHNCYLQSNACLLVLEGEAKQNQAKHNSEAHQLQSPSCPTPPFRSPPQQKYKRNTTFYVLRYANKICNSESITRFPVHLPLLSFAESGGPISMENPPATTIVRGSGSDSLTATLRNSIQALGRGFDVTSDIRLLYCKGATGSRLVQIDEDDTRDLVASDGVVITNVSVDIDGSPGKSGITRTPVYSFHEVIILIRFVYGF